MTERRKFPRVLTSIPSELLVATTLVSRGNGSIVNLSLGGLVVESDAQFNTGTDLCLYSKLPVKLCGTIIRSEKTAHTNRYAVRFSLLDDIEKLAFNEYIHSCLHKH